MLFFKGKEKKERTSNLSEISNLFSPAAPPIQSQAKEAKNQSTSCFKELQVPAPSHLLMVAHAK